MNITRRIAILLLAMAMTACSNPFSTTTGVPTPTAVPSAAPTVMPTATAAAPTTIPTVQQTIANNPPKLFDAQSCDPQQSPDGGCSWDIGTKGIDPVAGTAQFSLAFGVDISWPQGGAPFAADPNNACEIVALGPNTWFEDMNVKDARVEVYDVSMADYHGWINVLAVQRVAEQAGHYGCPATRTSIPFWTIIDGKPTVQQLMLKPLVGSSEAVDNSVVNQNGSMTISQCQAAYNDNISSWKAKDLSTEEKVLAALKAAGVTYDQIDFVRTADGNVQIASATNLHVPFPMGLATDATSDKLVQGAFKSVDLGGGNSLNSDVTLTGGFGGVIWYDVRNWKQFCGPEAQISNQAAPATTTAERQTTGKDQSLPFTAGTPVFGFKIVMADGTTYNQCYLADPKMGGTVTSGVLNPWATEVASAQACQ